jgi:hypothetical protein
LLVRCLYTGEEQALPKLKGTIMICASLILGAHLVSYHTAREPYYHNVNPGVYVECDGWTAGAYRNTLGRNSLYAGYTLHQGPFALSLGVASGYQKKITPWACRSGYISTEANPCTLGIGTSNGKVIPMIAPSVLLGPARLWYLPRVGSSSSAFHLSLQREWK